LNLESLYLTVYLVTDLVYEKILFYQTQNKTIDVNKKSNLIVLKVNEGINKSLLPGVG